MLLCHVFGHECRLLGSVQKSRVAKMISLVSQPVRRANGPTRATRFTAKKSWGWAIRVAVTLHSVPLIVIVATSKNDPCLMVA
jgi:hypothetical protein